MTTTVWLSDNDPTSTRWWQLDAVAGSPPVRTGWRRLTGRPDREGPWTARVVGTEVDVSLVVLSGVE